MRYEKLFESNISTAAAKAWKAQGGKVLGLICCHVPEEIFYAAGVLPVRMRATGCVDSSEAETWMSSFTCSFARSILQYWMDGTYELDGFVASDGCLMAARVFDNAAYINDKTEKGQFIRQIGKGFGLSLPNRTVYIPRLAKAAATDAAAKQLQHHPVMHNLAK